MSLNLTIEKSDSWMIKYKSLLDGINMSIGDREQLSISFQHLCIEHHTGIHMLINYSIFGSAYALLRPQFEAYIRGAWYYYCADKTQIQKFLQGVEPPVINTLIKDLKDKDAFENGSLSSIKSRIWSLLNDLTHGGLTQIQIRNTTNEIMSQDSVVNSARVLTQAATLSLLAGICIARAIENDQLAVNLNNAYDSIYKPRMDSNEEQTN